MSYLKKLGHINLDSLLKQGKLEHSGITYSLLCQFLASFGLGIFVFLETHTTLLILSPLPRNPDF